MEMPTPFPPLVSALGRPFWKGLRAEEIRVQSCEQCARLIFYPRPLCPGCGNEDLAWVKLSGAATLYTFTICAVPVASEFSDDQLILAIVQLEEGVRMSTRLIDMGKQEPRIGMKLEPVFDHAASPAWTLLYFRPAR